ncbi:MAG: hypothetical protein U5Q16_04200 [Gammaproteobacteria bacterium]|nr:hypothetical protein [Gammaproteobacteria bacterium]
MFLHKVKTEGLAHLSYVLGSAGEAAVFDPRRDFDIYLEIAAENGCRITHIFETHRNEDLISGAAVLADHTGATVHHGPHACLDGGLGRLHAAHEHGDHLRGRQSEDHGTGDAGTHRR